MFFYVEEGKYGVNMDIFISLREYNFLKIDQMGYYLLR